MICQNCGKEIENDAKFCTYCGAKIQDSSPSFEEKKTIEKQSAEDKTSDKKIPVLVKIAIPVVLVAIVIAVLASKVFIPSSNYDKAMALFEDGKYEEALSAFQTLNGYKDSVEKIDACNDEIEKAKIENDYNQALGLFDNGEYEKAIEAFTGLKGYKDSKDYITRAQSKIKMDSIQIGDNITFGKLIFTDLEWVVLDKSEDKVLLLTKEGILPKVYHPGLNSSVNVRWEDCELREYLNTTLYTLLFDESEKAAIQETKVIAEKNPDYNTDPGNDTKDKLFLLSLSEVEKYLPTDAERQCKVSELAHSYGAVVDSANGNGWWWLRTQGNGNNRAIAVDSNGKISTIGYSVYNWSYVIRPAMWINAEALV